MSDLCRGNPEDLHLWLHALPFLYPSTAHPFYLPSRNFDVHAKTVEALTSLTFHQSEGAHFE